MAIRNVSPGKDTCGSVRGRSPSEYGVLWGLAGWKWMYLLEAVPTILLGIVVLLYVTDRPAQARWLNDEERAWLVRFAR